MRAAQMATSQSGTIVIRNGRSVSLTEFELESKAKNTLIVPNKSSANMIAKAILAPIWTPLSGRRLTLRPVSALKTALHNVVIVSTGANRHEREFSGRSE